MLRARRKDDTPACAGGDDMKAVGVDELEQPACMMLPVLMHLKYQKKY